MAKAKIPEYKYLFQEHVCDTTHFFNGSSAIALLNVSVKPDAN